jgi:hypothetical protein
MAVDPAKVIAAAIDAAFNEAPPQAEQPRRKHSALRALVVGMGVAAAARVVAKRGPNLLQTVTSQYEGLRDKLEAEFLDEDLDQVPEAELDDGALDEVVPGEDEDEDVEDDDEDFDDDDEGVEEDEDDEPDDAVDEDDVEDEEPAPASRSRARSGRRRR